MMTRNTKFINNNQNEKKQKLQQFKKHTPKAQIPYNESDSKKQ